MLTNQLSAKRPNVAMCSWFHVLPSAIDVRLPWSPGGHEIPSYAKLCQAMPSYAKLCQAMPSYAKPTVYSFGFQDFPRYAPIPVI